MDTLNKNTFYDTIKLIYPVVKAIRDEQCELGKTQMKAIPDTTIGSRSRAVTSSDGVWMTRGYFSQKFSFTVWDYLGKNLLYYLHLSMRGSNDLVDEQLYPGISKSAEGYAAERMFKATKDEGLRIEVNWQDSDSSSGNAFKGAHPAEQNSKVMLCGGHVNRAHTKQLKEMPSWKSFSKGFIDEHKSKFPQVQHVTCVCRPTGRKHKQGCGYITKAFIQQVRVNFFSVLWSKLEITRKMCRRLECFRQTSF